MLQVQMLCMADCGESLQEQQSPGLCIQGSMAVVLKCRHEARPAKKLHHLAQIEGRTFECLLFSVAAICIKYIMQVSAAIW